MKLDEALDEFLGSAGHLKVLRALFALPEGVGFSGREVARRAGLAPHRTSVILSGLAENGLVHIERAPRLGLYQLNRNHAAAEQLGRLLEWEAGLMNQLAAEIRKALLKTPGIEAAALFGSAPWGGMTPGSDVDLLVLTPTNPNGLARVLENLGQEIRLRYGNRLEPMVLAVSKSQFVKSATAGKRLWRKILQNGIFIIDTPRRESAQTKKNRRSNAR
jgi:predicted nucleotidyltransferase